MAWDLRKKSRMDLQTGAARLDAVVRELRARQRAHSESIAERASVLSPSEEWSKKYLSRGIGPESFGFDNPIACFEDGTCLPPRDELMRELSARVAKARDCGCLLTTPMHRPFGPKSAKRKRSLLSRILFG